MIDRLSADLRQRFPEARGFSPRNIRYMRAFAVAWPDPPIGQRSAAQLPWRHHQYLLDKINGAEQRQWYAARAAEEGWSHDVLALKIESRLHERAGQLVSNFATALPEVDSDLARHRPRTRTSSTS